MAPEILARRFDRSTIAFGVLLVVPGVVLFALDPYVGIVWAAGYALLALSLFAAAALRKAIARGTPVSHHDPRALRFPLVRLGLVSALTAGGLGLAWLIFLAYVVATWPPGVP